MASAALVLQEVNVTKLLPVGLPRRAELPVQEKGGAKKSDRCTEHLL